jgi:hypothetical protein
MRRPGANNGGAETEALHCCSQAGDCGNAALVRSGHQDRDQKRGNPNSSGAEVAITLANESFTSADEYGALYWKAFGYNHPNHHKTGIHRVWNRLHPAVLSLLAR